MLFYAQKLTVLCRNNRGVVRAVIQNRLSKRCADSQGTESHNILKNTENNTLNMRTEYPKCCADTQGTESHNILKNTKNDTLNMRTDTPNAVPIPRVQSHNILKNTKNNTLNMRTDTPNAVPKPRVQRVTTSWKTGKVIP